MPRVVLVAQCFVFTVFNVECLENGRRRDALASIGGKADVHIERTGQAQPWQKRKAPSLLKGKRRPDCDGTPNLNLIHLLRRSRQNASVEETPFSYMRVDHHEHQVGLTLFDMQHDPSAVQTILDEDANALLQPFLQDVQTWREACARGNLSAEKILLALPPGSKHAKGSVWDDMAREFAAFITRKVLRKPPEDIQIWQPSRDLDPVSGLLANDSQVRCFQTVAVLTGEPWDYAWAQPFRCNTHEGRLVLRFVENFRQNHLVQSGRATRATAQVCLSSNALHENQLKLLELCELGGRPVQIQVASRAADVALCDALFVLPDTMPSGAELWLKPSSSLVEILPNSREPTRPFIENVALLTGAKRFTLGSSSTQVLKEKDLIDAAGKAILALNRATADAVDGALDANVAGVGELEGCEEFYHPKDGWMDGWREVARSAKLAKGRKPGLAAKAKQKVEAQTGVEDRTPG
ncbi:unnamed protein product [Durusdinium trenchii]|uniref:Uncharacterized protein n=2 Tax=Durusdinium trenchii TaxID=1381693 RepID=A0ABP0N5H2_9DINO